MFTVRRRTFAALSIAAACTGAAAPAAADPAAFATQAGTSCSSFPSPSVAGSSHAVAAYRVTLDSTLSSDRATIGSNFTQIRPGEIAWDFRENVGAGSVLYNPVNSCILAGPGAFYQVSWHDVPSGAVTYTGIGPLSYLPFIARADGPWQADLTLSQGSVEVSYPYGSSQAFSSSGTYLDPYVSGGSSYLRIGPLDGPRPAWTVTIRPAQPYLGSVTTEDPAYRSGTPITVRYGPNADMTMTATVAAAGGAPFRTIGSAFAAARGSRSVTWDGMNQLGVPVPDGAYTVALSGTDAYGQAAPPGFVTIRIDNTAPSVQVSPSRISKTGSLFISASDPSGLRTYPSNSVTIDGQNAGNLPDDGTGTVSPSSGWSYGSHTVAVKIGDRLGNEATRTFTFRQPCRTVRVAQRYRKTITRRVFRAKRWRYVRVRVWRTRYVNRTRCD